LNLKAQEIILKARKVVFNYPLVLLMSLVMTVEVIRIVQDNSASEERSFFITKIIFVSALGISLMFGFKMWTQRSGNYYFKELFGLLFLIGFYFVFPEKKEDFTEMYIFILVPVFVLSHLFVAFAAYFNKGSSEKSFWQYNKNLFVHFFLTIVFTGVLTGGVELAIWAVDRLFFMNFPNDVYLKTLFTLLIFGSTFIFLLFNEDGLVHLEKEGTYPVTLKFFTQFILIPLLMIYVVILYFYSVKILIQWSLPQGWVTYLILAYSVVGILALLLVYPLKEERAKSWVKVFSKVFYYTLIPLLVLLFVAIFTRILEYGFTEARYFVLLLALWLSLVVVYFVFMKKPSIKFIPISLFLLGIFALVFPYFNALSVSKRSQKKGLEKIFIENHLLVNGKIDFDKQITDVEFRNLRSKFDYLESRHQEAYLLSFIDEKTKTGFSGSKLWYLTNRLSKVAKIAQPPSQQERLVLTASETYYKINSYEYAVMQSSLLGKGVTIQGDHFQFESKNGQTHVLILNQKDSLDLRPLIEALCQKYEGRVANRKVDDLFIEGDLGKYQVKIVFNYLQRLSHSPKDASYWFENDLFFFRKTRP